MTKDDSHRSCVFSHIRVDRQSRHFAAIAAKVSPSSIYRWSIKERLTGNFFAARHRKSIDGKIPGVHQSLIFLVNDENPQWGHQEIANEVYNLTGWQYDRRAIRQLMFRNLFRYNKINEMRPMEIDANWHRFWIENVVSANGPINSQQIVALDESSKKKKDCFRLYAHGRRGQRVMVRVPFRRGGNAASVVLWMSLTGINGVVSVDVDRDGNIGNY